MRKSYLYAESKGIMLSINRGISRKKAVMQALVSPKLFNINSFEASENIAREKGICLK